MAIDTNKLTRADLDRVVVFDLLFANVKGKILSWNEYFIIVRFFESNSGSNIIGGAETICHPSRLYWDEPAFKPEPIIDF